MIESNLNRLRDALARLSRDSLAKLTERYQLVVTDRRSAAAHAAALAASSNLRTALGELKRDELKDLCSALALDSSGKEKELLVGRLLGEAVAPPSTGPLALTPTLEPEVGAKAPRQPRQALVAGESVTDYRHDATRKNNPSAGLVEFDKPPAQPTKKYAYDPHLDPALQWSGKAEHTSFEVDTVSLHIHERVSTQAIMQAVKREDAQRSLFAIENLPESKAIDFYAHDVDWLNRLVLGDSLTVMNSLLERENMAGRVQCIYLDPPYGVKFNSNFQPSISRRDVKDGDDGSLTREPEQIQAYRDTWTLGVHTYLTYLRDRLLLARELLTESGSIFVQISDENVHHVRELMDEVFGGGCFESQISFFKTTSKGAGRLDSVCDIILWFCRSEGQAKYHALFAPRGPQDDYNLRWVERRDGKRERLRTASEVLEAAEQGARVFRPNPITSTRPRGPNDLADFEFEGRRYSPGHHTFQTNEAGMARLRSARRLIASGNTLQYVRYLDDFPYKPINNVWTDTRQSGFVDEKIYVVQTAAHVIRRCLLMTTDPGDLVLDPTCGSGTTAYLAEEQGRRWITCDTSRVAISLARQRLLTARFPYFSLRTERVRDGFRYQSVPHVMLGAIAQNPKLDACKTQEEREKLIRDTAEQEILYDQPEEDRGRVRVSGPFTVEAIPVATMEDPDASPIPAMEVASPSNGEDHVRLGANPTDAGGDHITMMLDLLRKTGVHFKGNKRMPLDGLRSVKTASEWVHADGGTGLDGDPRRVAVSFGPMHGPVTPTQVIQAIQDTRGYDIVLFVGFACDPEARKMIDSAILNPPRELQFVAAAPDILVTDLLKTTKATKLFTVFGAPDVKVAKANGGGTVTVELRGVDLYDPNTGETHHDGGESVAAWFLDHAYDGKTFCICQAFFPAGKSKNPWEKLSKALKGTIDEDKFEALRGTKSVPFKPGKKVAVKVIDDRGNEVVKVVDGKA